MKKLLLILLGMLPLIGFGQLIEDFEGTWAVPTGAAGAGGPAGWAIVNQAGPDKKWEQGTAGSYAGAHHAQLLAEDVFNGTTTEDWLITPAVTVPANGQLTFYSKLSTPNTQGNTYEIHISTVTGSTALQTNLINYSNVMVWNESGINPVQTEWTQVTVSLADYAGQVVYIGFMMQGDNGDGWMIDNVNIGPACYMPSNLVATNITGTSATVSWTSPPDITSWEIEIVPATAAPTGAGIMVTTNPFTFTGLSGGAYKIYIRAVCGEGTASIWTPPLVLNIPVCALSAQCQYTFNLTDTGANGWNGNTVSVKQNGVTIAVLGMETGSASAIVVPLCDEVPFQLFWNEGGTLPDEIGVSVQNAYNQTVYTKPAGDGSQNSLLFQGMSQCAADGCYAPYNVAVSPQGTSATVNWQDSTTGPWQYFLLEGITSVPAVATTPPTGTTTTNPFTLNNLTPNTAYTLYVRTVCSTFGTTFNTDWSAPVTFSMGTGNYISGVVQVDADGDGVCNGAADYALPGAEVVVNAGNGGSMSVFANAEGEFVIDNLPNGTGVSYTIELGAIAGFEPLAPVTLTVNFPTVTPPQVTICTPMPVNPVNDIEVLLIPLNNAQAGFDANYALVVQNNSPVPATGVTVTLDYSSSNTNLLSANSTYITLDADTVTFTIGTIPAMGTSVTNAVFNVLPPPVNTGGESLGFTCYTAMDATDSVPENNTYSLGQVVVNAFDPNDITVHEGNFVPLESEVRYLHYTIRFQNTGTAPAVNIEVQNQLDANLDWSTFDPVAASHDYTAVRNANGLVSFKFDNIFLADSTSSEPASHGFVTYRIEPKADIDEGDLVNSSANIFFDFNEPVTTNTAVTEFYSVLSINDNEMGRVVLYPNPVKDLLYISALQSTVQSAAIYDINGRLCLTSGGDGVVNTAALSPGIYLVKVTTDKGTSSYKLIKQ